VIAPSDPDYQDTKRVMQGQKTLAPALRALADWIATHWPGMTVLNLYYDLGERTARKGLPRLNVVLETEAECRQFQGSNFDPARQADLVAAFGDILTRHPGTAFSTRDMSVVFTAFEPVARTEAIWSITREDIIVLEAKLNNPAIWTIKAEWHGASVFFHTEAEKKSLCDGPFSAACVDAFAEVVRKYDAFGYFARRPATLCFESKENFDKTYHGNWFFYDRR
jgi:hypothetical protein